MVVAASPSSSPAPHAAPGRPHPTYTKMITHALTVLGGASARPAIAGYILDRFSGLPARHDALLSAHLRRLVAEDVLQTDGADSPSYLFDPPPPSEQKRGPGRPRMDSDPPTPVPVVGEKRSRGRPRKSPHASSEPSPFPAKRNRRQSLTAPTEVQSPGSVLPVNDDSVTNTGTGTSTTQAGAVAVEGQARTFQTTPVQSRGASLADIKRGRGRPRKEKPLGAAAAMSPESASTTRGRGRPRKEKPSEPVAAPAVSFTAGSVAASLRRFKRGCGRPSMGRPSAASMGTETGVGTPRKEKPAAATSAPETADDDSSTGIKRPRGRPRKEKPAAATSAPETADDESFTGIKRPRGRPRKEKSAAAAMSAGTGEVATVGTEAGVEQSSMEKLAAAMFAEPGGDATVSSGTEVGGGPSRMEKLAAAREAMSSKRGRGRPRKKKPSPQAEVKRSRGRPRRDQSNLSPTTQDRKDQSTLFPKSQSIGAGLVEAACELLFKDVTTKATQVDLVLWEKTQIIGVAPGDTEESKVADEGDKTQTKNGIGPGNRKDTSAASIHAEYVDAASGGTESGVGIPRMEESLAARSPETGDARRPRGRPRKKPAVADGVVSTAEAMSAETGDVVSKVVKRGRGRPRMEKPMVPSSAGTADAAATGVKRGRGRPRKVRSFGTWFAEAAAEALFKHRTEAPEDSVSAERAQADGVSLGDRKETRVADA